MFYTADDQERFYLMLFLYPPLEYIDQVLSSTKSDNPFYYFLILLYAQYADVVYASMRGTYTLDINL